MAVFDRPLFDQQLWQARWLAFCRHFHIEDKQAMRASLRMILLGAAIGLAIFWSVVGIAFLFQLRGLQADFVTLRKENAVLNGRVSSLERTLRNIAEQPDAAPPPVAADAPPKPPLTLSSGDIAVIRQFIRVAPASGNAQPTLKVGDTLPAAGSLPMPQPLVDKLPKLQGTRFAIDQNGAIVITDVGEDRVAAVIVAGPPASAN